MTLIYKIYVKNRKMNRNASIRECMNVLTNYTNLKIYLNSPYLPLSSLDFEYSY